MSVALSTVRSSTMRSQHASFASVPTADLVAASAITGMLILATAATATVGPMPRTGASIVDLGLLALVFRRYQPVPAAVATVVVVITSVLTAPQAVKAPVLAAIALAAYSVVRYASGSRLLLGMVACIGGVATAWLVLPPDRAHGVTLAQLEVVLVLLPAVTAALIRVRGKLPGLLRPQSGPGLFVAGPTATADDADDHLLDLGRALRRVASWLESGRLSRDRILSGLAGGLVLLVLVMHRFDPEAVPRDVAISRDIAGIALAVIAVGSVALVGRLPWLALLVALVAAVAFTGIASLPDAYSGVIGGVVVIGLPLIVGGMLRLRPALIALVSCLTAIAVMGLVSDVSAVGAVGAADSCGEVLSSVALAVGAWSAGRVLRRGARAAWTGAGRLMTAPVSVREPPLLPNAGELVQRVGMLGLRPTTIRVDPLAAGERLPDRVAEVVGNILDEALDNAARHAPGSDLMIKVLPERAAIRIEVVNGPPMPADGCTPGGGRGVPELASRIAEVGGMFCVGPASGGFALRARLPFRPARDPVRDHDREVVATPVR